MITIARLDHLVLTATDPKRTIAFYEQVLGMQPVISTAGRLAVHFGQSKINIHQSGHEITPHAAHPTPGSADLCLISSTPTEQVLVDLNSKNIRIEEGPVQRTGAEGPITSVYIRDPDSNLIEVSGTIAVSPDTGTRS